MKEGKTQISWKKIALIVTCVLLSLVLIVLILAAVFMDRLLGEIDREPETRETLSSEQLEELLKPNQTIGEDYTDPVFNASDVTVPTGTVEVVQSDNVVNIMLVGQDGAAGLTDVMILCSINKETNTVTMTSFLRDLYLNIPGHYRNDKLNVAYPLGGFKMIDDALKVNFGVQVDGNMRVDFSQFTRIIDLLGGVDIYLSGAEASHLNSEYGFGLSSGVQHLNGERALAYARIRKIDSDFNRTSRQRNVISAILNQLKNASVSQLMNTVTAVLNIISTDMSDADIMKYVAEFAPMLKNLNIVSQHIPVEGTYYFGGVKDQNIVDCIFIKDFETNRKLLADVLDG